VHSLVRFGTARCSRISAGPTCGCRSRSRSLPRARQRSRRAARSRRRARSPLRAPDARASRCCRSRGRRGARWHVPVRVQRRRTRSPWPRSSTAASASRDRRHRGAALEQVDGAPARDLAELVAADAAARRRRARAASGMTIFIAIVGLGLLVFVHELGHFSASVALGCARASSTSASRLRRQAHAQRDRVRHRADPARRLREDPRHAPARLGDVDPVFGRAIEEAPRSRGEAERLRRPSTGRPRRGTRVARALPTLAAEHQLSSPRARGSTRASPTSATRSARTRTGAPRPGSACS
jgi:hypothetical protein